MYESLSKQHKNIVDVFSNMNVSFDRNDPKVRWAQQIADRSGENQVIVVNAIGGLDIKPESAVELINNPQVKAVIERSDARINSAEKEDRVSDYRTVNQLTKAH